MTHLRMAIFAAFFLMPINIAFAHDGATGVVKERMDFMSNLGAAMKSLSKIVKGRVEFDSDKVLELTAQLREHSGTNLTKLFPKGSLDKPTTAIPEIWQNWDKFNGLAESLYQRAKDMSTITQDKSIQPEDRIEAMSRAFKRVAKICSACHRDFRKKKKR